MCWILAGVCLGLSVAVLWQGILLDHLSEQLEDCRESKPDDGGPMRRRLTDD